MFDQIFDRTLYCLMAAVLVIPEPTTFLVCLLLVSGIVAHCGSHLLALVRSFELAESPELAVSDEMLSA
jgi:hypothetical protein